ncbi:MAG: hypothetical protein CSA44_02275 [Gammaproteobacteria bacterium]|nr:MAG: hypothetical protein CSA44_02275 [Gammaproteobacteria bacterium]
MKMHFAAIINKAGLDATTSTKLRITTTPLAANSLTNFGLITIFLIHSYGFFIDKIVTIN